MHRLLQGEVGSGKTVVALRAMLAAIDAGGQAALLAPTEVLAAQHHRSITAMLGDLAQGGMLGGSEFGTTVALLTGSQSAATRRRSLLDAASGEAGIVVGTHALIQKHVQFADLALVVVDEQHRFGVEQRDALREKGIRPPHVLVMTATPIPRTVAMTVFGDMETSTLRELPAGARPSRPTSSTPTSPAGSTARGSASREEVAKGHQAYVVCPRIGDVDDEPGSVAALRPGDTSDEDAGWDAHWETGEDGEDRADGDDAPSAELTGVYAMLSTAARQPRPSTGCASRCCTAGSTPTPRTPRCAPSRPARSTCSSRRPSSRSGSTSPNASVMVVVDADRFGISQLHQLRGRVGRGCGARPLPAHDPGRGERAAERLDQVAATTDGFELARADLLLRREGDVLGARQSGRGNSVRHLRLGRLEDEQIIADAREDAFALVDRRPRAARAPGARRRRRDAPRRGAGRMARARMR